MEKEKADALEMAAQENEKRKKVKKTAQGRINSFVISPYLNQQKSLICQKLKIFP